MATGWFRTSALVQVAAETKWRESWTLRRSAEGSPGQWSVTGTEDAVAAVARVWLSVAGCGRCRADPYGRWLLSQILRGNVPTRTHPSSVVEVLTQRGRIVASGSARHNRSERARDRAEPAVVELHERYAASTLRVYVPQSSPHEYLCRMAPASNIVVPDDTSISAPCPREVQAAHRECPSFYRDSPSNRRGVLKVRSSGTAVLVLTRSSIPISRCRSARCSGVPMVRRGRSRYAPRGRSSELSKW